MALSLHIDQLFSLGLNFILDLLQLLVLLLIRAQLPLPLVHFRLDSLLCQVHLMDVLFFPLTDFLGPVRISSVELAQEVLLGFVQGLLGAM